MKTMECLKYYYGLANKDCPTDEDYNLNEVEAAYQRLQKIIEQDRVRIYGVHTGYGNNVKDAKDAKSWQEDQLKLLNYLKVGVGDYLSEKIVRRALRIQALKIARGYSGTSPTVYKKLWQLSNLESGKLPKVPKYGSLGASGDLIPMAHAVAPIFEQTVPKGQRDVISLVNTNSMMCSYSIELYRDVQNIVQRSFEFIALASIGMDANLEHFAPEGFAMNPKSEPATVSLAIRDHRKRFLESYSMDEIEENRAIVQEKYSMRCFPHILGQVCRNMKYVQTEIENETKQVSDNPLILKNGKVWHGGHFYAVGIATAADLMKDACMRISEVTDRVILNLMDEGTNKKLPNNLELHSGDHVKGIHQLVSSLYQRAKGLNLPSVMMSFSCEGNNQDVVPCSMNALNQLSDLIEISQKIMQAGMFIAERSALMRIGEHIPMRLRLDSWRQQNAI